MNKHVKEQQKARLHISLEKAEKSDIIKQLKQEIKENSEMPTGATIREGTGLWFPRDDDGNINQDMAEHEQQLTVEIWMDDKEELHAVKKFRDVLEVEFEQWCVCLETVTSTFEHTHEGDE